MKTCKFRTNLAASFGIICVLLIIGLFSSCSKDAGADARDLLATVPSDASGVAIIDVEEILDKLGCKVSKTEITLSPELAKAYQSKNPEKNAKDGETTTIDLGVAPTSIVMFFAERPFMTGVIDDPAKFKEYIEKEQKGTFKEEQGVNVLDDMAYVGNQFWISMTGSINPERILQFTKLGKEQSYLSNELSETLLKMDHDVAALASIDAILNNTGHQRNGLRLAITSVFEDATWIGLDGEFDKNELDMSISVYGSNQKPSKFLLPFEKIDVATVRQLGGKADMVFAAGVPSALIKKVLDVFSAFGGGFPKDITDALGNIDGTMAFATSMSGSGAKGIVTTDGKAGPTLLEMLSNQSGMTVTRDGKYLRLQSGTSCGNIINIENAASEFKGAYFGLMASGKTIGQGVKETVFTAKPDNGSLEFDFKITFDKDVFQNFSKFMK